jgi:4-amino-4-deoxy-L-arabinose transferase-like glycosyltransferase
MEQIKSKVNIWPVFAAAAMIIIIVGAICWSVHHPYGASWDEAEYLNEAQIDAQRLQHGMLLRLGGRILIKSWGRPPAYRVLALPVLGLFGFNTVTVRLVSLACFALSSLFVYLAACRVGSSVAGGFAVLVFCLSPLVISASMWFSTEGPLYLATSAMLYYLFRCWTDKLEHWDSWVGLGLAIGTGLLAKVSFIAIVVPVLVLWLAVGRRRELGIPNLSLQWKAGLLALLVAAPWWLSNIKPAMSMTQQARGYVANSLGPPSLVTWLRWLSTVGQSLLGYGLSILITLVVIAALREAIVRKKVFLDPLQRLALGACACAGAPIMLAQLTGTNHLLRHISPALIPLAITVGVLADWSGWARAGLSMAISGVLFCAQLVMIVAPVLFPNSHPVNVGMVNGSYPWQVMARVDQWDWTPVEEISRRCGVDSPRISYVGGNRAFNPPQIERPWATAAASTGVATFPYPAVRWLWRYEEGPINWQKVMASAEESDIVITAPHFAGDLSNQHNSEFSDRLSQDPHFQEPIRLEMGRFEPVDVLVFVNQTLVCHSGNQAPGSW